MKVCAIEIKSNKIIFFVLEKDSNSELIESTGKIKSIILDDDHNHTQVIDFIDTVHSHFNSLEIDKIVILSRSSKGQFSSSGISFKLEGLIQAYKNKTVEFVSPKTLIAFYKKNTLTINPQFGYQMDALRLAFYTLNS
nr:DUF3010 family protein [uncultured Flavobacterium sp.]